MSVGRDNQRAYLDLNGSAQNGHIPPTTGPVEPLAPQLGDGNVDTNRVSRTAVPPPRWEIRYAQVAAVSDLMAMALSLGFHKLWGAWPGYDHARIAFGLAIMALTVIALGFAGAWEPSVQGQGSEEFSRLLRALITLGVVVGLIGLALKLPQVRPYVFGVIPVALILAAIGRLVLRKGLYQRRQRGACMHEVLAVGTEDAVAKLIARTRQSPQHGWTVTGACTPSGAGSNGGLGILDVPVVGDLDSVSQIAGSGGYRVVSVAQTPGWSSQRLHHLAWDLEGTGAELVVDPGLMEIAGPRLHVAAVNGLPLLRLTEPAFTGLPRVVKGVIDRTGAALLLLIIAPVLIAVAIAVRCDGGPVFYRQSRVGKAGKPFMMVKFRSMMVDADQHRRGLEEGNEGCGPLFKLRQDPRVTRVGAFLRRYSLDELPQLFNVLSGAMSLVGPRPPLPQEVASYSRDAQRKLLVKPGMTGLWQISGRSDLSWEESVRLDLRYVENWSLALDALIVWKTVGAVMRGTGAY
jgi:exopolysaccharide biosynthesis polyprenyl glycosylphosphotransferase